MQTPMLPFNNDIWDAFIEALRVINAEELLDSFNMVILHRILTVQLQKANGDTALAVSNAAGVLRNMESAIGQLHEHERMMGKAYFEELVKSDAFLIRGQANKSGTPLAWLRDGYMSKGIWRLEEGSSRVHAYI